MQREGQQHDRQDGLWTESADNGLGDRTEAQAHTVHRELAMCIPRMTRPQRPRRRLPQGTEVFGLVGCSSRSGGVSSSGRIGQGAGQNATTAPAEATMENRTVTLADANSNTRIVNSREVNQRPAPINVVVHNRRREVGAAYSPTMASPLKSTVWTVSAKIRTLLVDLKLSKDGVLVAKTMRTAVAIYPLSRMVFRNGINERSLWQVPIHSSYGFAPIGCRGHG